MRRAQTCMALLTLVVFLLLFDAQADFAGLADLIIAGKTRMTENTLTEYTT